MHIKTATTLLLCAVAANAAELTIAQGMVAPEKPASLNVQLATGGTEFTGIQFDVEYDATALDVTVQRGPAAEQAGKSISSNVIQPGKRRVLVIGFNRNAISDGVVAILQVALKGSGDAGKSFPVKVTGLMGTNQRAETLSVAGHDGGVKVETRRNGQ